LEGVFHVKSRVSVAFSFIVLRYVLVAFIIKLMVMCAHRSFISATMVFFLFGSDNGGDSMSLPPCV
jgi:hypothetical protein